MRMRMCVDLLLFQLMRIGKFRSWIGWVSISVCCELDWRLLCWCEGFDRGRSDMGTTQGQAVTVRDLVEEAKKRIVILLLCVIGLSYIMSRECLLYFIFFQFLLMMIDFFFFLLVWMSYELTYEQCFLLRVLSSNAALKGINTS